MAKNWFVATLQKGQHYARFVEGDLTWQEATEVATKMLGEHPEIVSEGEYGVYHMHVSEPWIGRGWHYVEGQFGGDFKSRTPVKKDGKVMEASTDTRS